MLLSPIQNSASQILGVWIQKRPRITQKFAENPQIYGQFGMRGHNGIDYGGKDNDHNIFAPMSGRVRVKNSGDGGYGLHIKLRDSGKEVVLGHLSKVFIKDGDYVHIGDKIGVMGNTGFSTGTHLHYGLRFLEKNDEKDVFKYPVKDYDNGYLGYVNPFKYTITWKGSLAENTLS